MAYYLNFDGVDDYVNTNHHVDIDFTSDSYELEFEFDFSGSSSGTICSQCIGAGLAEREFHVFISSSNFNIWFSSGGSSVDTGYQPVGREVIVLSVNSSALTYNLTADGVTVASGSFVNLSVSEPTAVFLIGARNNGSLNNPAFFASFPLYRLKLTKGTTLLHDYDPSASGGTGSTLPDIEGGQNGTLINFPTDDSQWVFYNDGGVLLIQGLTPNCSYSPISASVDLTGSIDVAGATASYSYQSVSGVVDLTATIDVQGETASYSYTPISASIELTGVISIDGNTADYQYNAVTGTVTLQGAINIQADTAQYTYTALSANITLDSGLRIARYTAVYEQDVISVAYEKDEFTARFQ